MNYYLVDFENVKKDGLDGIHKLEQEDRVCILYSKNADSITFEQHKKIMESKADIELCKVDVGSKNALDFQLATQLGFLIANKSADNYYIVSKDKGFEILSGYWKSRGVSVTLIADIMGRSHDHEMQEMKEKLQEMLSEILRENDDVTVEEVLKTIQQYKTKQGIMNALMKKYPSADNKKSSKIYKTIKPLLSDKKGSEGWQKEEESRRNMMKKKKVIFTGLFILLAGLGLCACGDKKESSDNLEGALTDIMTTLYANAELDPGFRESLDGYETIAITDDLESYILGTDEITYTEGVVSMPQMSSMAYQCVLLRVDEADVEAAKQLLKDNADPDKWVCVSAETTLIESRGNVIFFIMSGKNEAYAMNTAFQNL